MTDGEGFEMAKPTLYIFAGSSPEASYKQLCALLRER